MPIIEWDRSPIGLWPVARPGTVSPANPHGLFEMDDTSDPNSVIVNAVDQTNQVIAHCNDIGAQGIIFQNGFTAGFKSTVVEWQNPTPLPPELQYIVGANSTTTLLDHLLDMIHNAGLRSGTTLRPAFPTYNVMTGVFTGMVPAPVEVPPGPTSLRQLMDAKINWCKGKGMSLFYLDAHYGWTGNPWSVDWSDFSAAHSDVLLSFESVNRGASNEDLLFQWGIPWTKQGGMPPRQNAGENVLFAVDYLGDVYPNQTDDQIKTRIRKNLDGGDIVAPFVHFKSKGYRLLKEVLSS